ncbi:MAG: hypothetical protein A3F67_00660 [Verrucomicrobia bacterium RIFCSPHIGHO2_12_FULL_41_10]|nr:MAG: hypothetical protein A3F67_00660 [Verrucomicrobia bacterium RIFCSPHIGHO2_12_FULL_41_10]HLB34169.1 hypothetical protein [Chthoniobacterales bacterium]
MIPHLPAAAASVTAQSLASNIANLPDPGDISQAASHAAIRDMQLSPDAEAFYTVGTQKCPCPVSSLPPSMNMTNVFDDFPKFLRTEGGPSSAVGLLAAQMEVTQVTLGWSLIGQMASKASSGIQSLFNNQV